MDMNVSDWILVISWGLLVDISIFVLKFKKSKELNSNYKLWHASIMLMVFIASVTALLLIILDPESEMDPMKIVLFSAVILNTIGGLFMYIFTRVNYFSSPLAKLKIVHKINGYIFYIASKIELFLILNSSFIFIYIALAVSIQIFVHIYLTRKISLRNYIPGNINIIRNSDQEREGLVNDINSGMSIADLREKYKATKWVIFGNKICDLTNFDHPGGKKIIDVVIGREVSRFIYGGHKAEKLFVDPHDHSTKALEIIDLHCIGNLTGFESILVKDLTERESSQQHFRELELRSSSAENSTAIPLLRSVREEVETCIDDIWKLKSKTELSNKLCRFEFYNPYFKVKSFSRHLNSFGRYFLIRRKNDPQQVRTYTCALSMTKMSKRLLDDLVFYFESIMEQRASVREFQIPKVDDCLPLFIKDFDSRTGLSKKIHASDPGEEFIIEGPISRGLNINKNTKGELYFICGGTGILAFIDFLFFFLLKLMNSLSKGRIDADVNYFKELRMKFDDLNDDIKVNLIEVFTEGADSYGVFIVKKLEQLEKKYKLNKFTLQNIISKKEGKFNQEYMAKNVKIDQNCTYYVCGPPLFNEQIPSSLINLGAQPHSIILV